MQSFLSIMYAQIHYLVYLFENCLIFHHDLSIMIYLFIYLVLLTSLFLYYVLQLLHSVCYLQCISYIHIFLCSIPYIIASCFFISIFIYTSFFRSPFPPSIPSPPMLVCSFMLLYSVCSFMF